MKKISFTLLALSAMASTSMAFAELSKADLAGYYSAQHPRMSLAAATLATYPATDITVVNATASVLHTVVPNSPIYDTNATETNDHIRHDTMVGKTHIQLQDPYNTVFFDKFVCRLAVVTAYGVPGAYRVSVDEEYCNRP